jgi:hypothetical protein
MKANRPFDADTHRQGAASRARVYTSCGALPVSARSTQTTRASLKVKPIVGIRRGHEGRLV